MGATERRPCRWGPLKGDPADGDNLLKGDSADEDQ